MIKNNQSADISNNNTNLLQESTEEVVTSPVSPELDLALNEKLLTVNAHLRVGIIKALNCRLGRHLRAIQHHTDQNHKIKAIKDTKRRKQTCK